MLYVSTRTFHVSLSRTSVVVQNPSHGPARLGFETPLTNSRAHRSHSVSEHYYPVAANRRSSSHSKQPAIRSSAPGIASNPAIQIQHAMMPLGDRIIIFK